MHKLKYLAFIPIIGFFVTGYCIFNNIFWKVNHPMFWISSIGQGFGIVSILFLINN